MSQQEFTLALFAFGGLTVLLVVIVVSHLVGGTVNALSSEARRLTSPENPYTTEKERQFLLQTRRNCCLGLLACLLIYLVGLFADQLLAAKGGLACMGVVGVVEFSVEFLTWLRAEVRRLLAQIAKFRGK